MQRPNSPASVGAGGLFGRGEIVAGALNLVGSSALYGRNWGCKYGDAFKGLHMELCYYQAIEHAIELGLEVRGS